MMVHCAVNEAAAMPEDEGGINGLSPSEQEWERGISCQVSVEEYGAVRSWIASTTIAAAVLTVI